MTVAESASCAAASFPLCTRRPVSTFAPVAVCCWSPPSMGIEPRALDCIHAGRILPHRRPARGGFHVWSVLLCGQPTADRPVHPPTSPPLAHYLSCGRFLLCFYSPLRPRSRFCIYSCITHHLGIGMSAGRWGGKPSRHGRSRGPLVQSPCRRGSRSSQRPGQS